jgi:hypothetical protein
VLHAILCAVSLQDSLLGLHAGQLAPKVAGRHVLDRLKFLFIRNVYEVAEVASGFRGMSDPAGRVKLCFCVADPA